MVLFTTDPITATKGSVHVHCHPKSRSHAWEEQKLTDESGMIVGVAYGEIYGNNHRWVTDGRTDPD